MPSSEQLIELNRIIGELSANVKTLTNAVYKLEIDVNELKLVAHRWKGAFGLLLMAGSAIAWVVSQLPPLWEKH